MKRTSTVFSFEVVILRSSIGVWLGQFNKQNTLLAIAACRSCSS